MLKKYGAARCNVVADAEREIVAFVDRHVHRRARHGRRAGRKRRQPVRERREQRIALPEVDRRSGRPGRSSTRD